MYDEKLNEKFLYYKKREEELNKSINIHKVKNEKMIINMNELNKSIKDKNNEIEELL